VKKRIFLNLKLPGVFILPLLFMHLHARAQTSDGTRDIYYKLKLVYLPVDTRPELGYKRDQLGFKSIGGDLPKNDGQQFQLNIFNQRVGSTGEATRIISGMMTSLHSALQTGRDLRIGIAKTSTAADQKYIQEQVKAAEASTSKKLTAKVGSAGQSAQNFINEPGDDLLKQSKFSITSYRYDEYYDNTRIDNTAINLTSRSGLDFISVNGKFYTHINLTNKKSLPVQSAVAQAIAQLKTQNKFNNITARKAPEEMVLLPYSGGFKYAWKAQVMADGPYQVWADAETGKVLQLLPLFVFSDNAQGRVFNPNPFAGTTVITFEVDPAHNGMFTLGKAGFMTITTAGADGFGNAVQVPDNGSGFANFDVAPINGTVVDKITSPGYNGLFQQVNVYGRTFNLRRYYELIGSQNFGVVNIVVDQAGTDNAGPNSFFACTGTLNGATACGTLFNTAIDLTVVSHEFGHIVIDNQFAVGGGMETGSIAEGMADFWSCTTLNVDTVGAWAGKNCPTANQNNLVPRALESLDIFAHHIAVGGTTNAHSVGQIIGWANWSSRQGMNDAMDVGTLSINLNMLRAMTTAGIGITPDGTEQTDHAGFVDLLKQITPLYSGSRLINKVLAGYARAGIFLADQDAVIDIDHSYLNRASTTGPTFTVWTGRDFTFVNTVSDLTSQPFNTQFMVEVANDPAFTTNLKTSGWLGGVVAGDGGKATWTLPAAAWNVLKAGTDIYYRVTTKDGVGGNIRQSWNPGNGFLLNTPVGRANINGTGTADCACSAANGGGSSGMALITLIPVAVLLPLRRKFKKQKSTGASANN